MKPPPATRRARKPRTPRESDGTAPSSQQRGRWEEQFRALATALGLDPEEMLERSCRDWVETTRTRALAAPVALLPSGSEAELGT